MIQYFKINQSTDNTLLTVHNNLAASGNTGLIVCEDNRRIYYQDSNSLHDPILIGVSNYWEIVSDSQSDIQVLEVGKKYIRTGTHQSFTLPTNEYAQTVGDTIEFFNKNNENLVINDGVNSFINTINTSGHFYKFYWDGTNWVELAENNSGSQYITINQKLNTFWNATDSIIYTSALPSATLTGDWGITTIESSYVSSVISGSPYPMAASAVYSYIDSLDLSSGGGGGGSSSPATLPTLSSVYTSANIVSSNYLQVDGNAIPVYLQTNLNNYYPIEKGTLSREGSSFLINTTPYLTYDNVGSFAGQWTVYYGAGLNDVYTTANTVSSVVVSSSPYNIRFTEADVYVLTFNAAGTFTLTNSDLAAGHGMIIKLINTGGATIMFGGHVLVSTVGSYSFSIFNFGTGAEQVGEVTTVYTNQS